jgi:uncharacterized protein
VPLLRNEAVPVHDPTVFPELPAGSGPLVLPGHTHRGQGALLRTPHRTYLAPIRVNAPPQVALSELFPEG